MIVKRVRHRIHVLSLALGALALLGAVVLALLLPRASGTQQRSLGAEWQQAGSPLSENWYLPMGELPRDASVLGAAQVQSLAVISQQPHPSPAVLLYSQEWGPSIVWQPLRPPHWAEALDPTLPVGGSDEPLFEGHNLQSSLSR